MPPEDPRYFETVTAVEFVAIADGLAGRNSPKTSEASSMDRTEVQHVVDVIAERSEPRDPRLLIY